MSNHSLLDYKKFLQLLLQANLHRQKREYGSALDIYIYTLDHFGETDLLDQTIAHCYFEIGLYERDESSFQYAIQWIKKAVTLTPNKSQFYADLGQFYALGTLEYQAAVNEYKIALEIDPNNERALVGGAALYGVPEAVVSLNEAIDWLIRAVNINPADSNYHFRLGALYYEADRLPEAENEFSKALLCAHALDSSAATMISRYIERM